MKTAKQKAPLTPRRPELHGLSLPAVALRALQARGIYCASGVSLEHQHLAGRYVLRGVESGGAVVDMGRSCGFVSPGGEPLPWLQAIDSIAVNGRHAIIVAQSLVRLEMMRSGRSCELAISLHTISPAPGTTRPHVVSKMLFRGRDGVLPVELWQPEYREVRGQLTPVFYTRSGEIVRPPSRFEDAVRKITAAVCCVGCKHPHIAVSRSER